MVALTAVLFLIGLVATQRFFARGANQTLRPATSVTLPEALAQPNAFKPLTMEQAVEANHNLPFTTRHDDPARKFVQDFDKAAHGNQGAALKYFRQPCHAAQ